MPACLSGVCARMHLLGNEAHCLEWSRQWEQGLESTAIVFTKLDDFLVQFHVPSMAAVAAFASLHAVRDDLHPQITQWLDTPFRADVGVETTHSDYCAGVLHARLIIAS